ncbi:hypothetical protein [Salirhabdus sp. Marseille-P4669]|uniref:hypothetical protein n=1 Tax=Salirhabdus sp. Marseille-P4669 TaxID=2042310 RepID=UPI000C7C3C90|nr:hypothetical protein [Salirhabdus sp. Marseille-P4669]
MNNFYLLPTQYYIPNQGFVPNFTNPYRQQYPPVDTAQFTKSAEAFQSLMIDAKRIIDQFATSKQFAKNVMEHAQKSDTKTVSKLIKETGIKNPVRVKFTPDGINIELDASVEDVDCCKLVMALHW